MKLSRVLPTLMLAATVCGAASRCDTSSTLKPSEHALQNEKAPQEGLKGPLESFKKLIKASGPDLEFLAREEAVEQAKYEKRCVVASQSGKIDFKSECDRTQKILSERVNSELGQFQKIGRLKKMEPFQKCEDFHWADPHNHTEFEMTAAPGVHSHFKHDGMSCVSSLNVFMEQDDLICRFATYWGNEGNPIRIDIKEKGECTGRNFNIQGALSSLGQKLEPVELE